MNTNHLRRTGLFIFILVLLPLVLIAFTAYSQDSPQRVVVRSPQEALRYDATHYADTFGVSVDEAMRRLNLSESIGEFAALLAEKEPDAFAGFWQTHASEYRAYIAFTHDGQALLDSYLPKSSWRNHITLETATYTYQELRAVQLELAEYLINDVTIEATLGIDQEANKIEVKVLDQAKASSVLAAQESRAQDMITISEVKELPQPELNDYAGLRQSGNGTGTIPKGTSGYIVFRTSKPSLRFHSTAGHIEGTVWVYAGTANRRRLPIYREFWGGSFDFQLHRIPSTITPKPWAVDNIGNDNTPYYREMTDHEYTSLMQRGDWVCHWGSNTGYSCGTIWQNDLCMEVDGELGCPYIVVNNAKHGVGDSGGPWYYGSVAYGTHVGGAGIESIFMPFSGYERNGFDLYTIYDVP